MKLSIEWLKRYCPNALKVHDVAGLLTSAGLEVEAIDEAPGGDFVLDAEVTSNRPDWLSHLGVARDLAVLGAGEFTPPQVAVTETAPPTADLTSVTVEDTAGCPRYTARMITDVTIGPSPQWLQQALTAIGLRPINNIVDITNYVLFECGQPLHAFDFDKLEEGRIIVRRARKGERVVSIDGGNHQLAPSDLIIADGRRPVAIAGVMGGLETEISNSARTVLLESAFFDPITVRDTSRRLELESDSSYRFERRVDPGAVAWASDRAAALIAELAGGKVHAGLIDMSALTPERPEITLRHQRVERLLGMPVEPARIREILAGLGFEITGDDKTAITVLAPTFRADVTREIDLIEEVTRVFGYDRIQGRPSMTIRPGHLPRNISASDRAADILASCGYFEAVTFSFTTEEETQRYTPWDGDGVLSTRISYKAGENVLRKTLMPSLLASYAVNRRRGNRGVKLFEMSRVFLPKTGQKLPDEKQCIALLDGESFRSAKGAVMLLLERLGIEGVETQRAEMAIFERDTALRLLAGGELLGVMGVLTAQEAERYDLSGPPTLVELDFDAILRRMPERRGFAPVPMQPASRRDLALVLDIGIDWAEVERVIGENKPAILERLEFFDEYRGRQVPRGKKSLAFSLTFRDASRTLSSDEVDAAVQSLLDPLRERLGAALRGE